MTDDLKGLQPKNPNKLPIRRSAEAASSELVSISDVLPPNLFLLPVTQTTVFPSMMVPLILPEGKLTKTIDYVMEGAGYVGIVHYKNQDEEAVARGPSSSMTGLPAEEGREGGPSFPKNDKEPFYRYGVAAKIVKRINLPDNQVSILLTGLQRFELTRLVSKEPYLVGGVKYLYEEVDKGVELEALMRSALSQFKQISKDNPLISEEMKVALVNIDSPGKLADFMASVLIRELDDYQRLLASPNVKDRLHQLLMLLKKEQEVQAVQRKIQEEINQKVSSSQREFYLHEQLKSIQRELGRFDDDKSKLIQKFKDRLNGKSLKPETKGRVEEEIEKLNTLNEQSSEYSVAVNYVDWATSLPWGVRTDENYDLQTARKTLEHDHYGLKEVKDRILEFLAVRKLKRTSEGSIICFVGPPGTGKTSLGKSIAAALNRKFFRFSVGGMRDEAEIKGHRRTYVGAMPGKLVQGLKRVGAQNPVFLIDEIDKIGGAIGSVGDPASALLELLDPEQNSEFLDHYLDIPFDCSEVFFITTANTVDTIPSALLDRMEVIYLHGYSEAEKLQIAHKHLLPKLKRKHALKATQLKFSEKALRYIVHHYARESGVRQLEKQLAKICRKVAYRVAMGTADSVNIKDVAVVEKFLGLPSYTPEIGMKKAPPGVSTGLAWTQQGGEILFVESVAVEGKGGFTLTGSLGEVMQESANIAYTYVREHARDLNLPKNFFEKHLLHLHVPAGATPKDGPSAGITMAASLYSLIANKPVNPAVAMTGEITLTGRVLPVGGIKEKVLAAKRANIRTVLLSKHNERDVRALDPEIRKGLQFVKISTVDEGMRYLF